MVKYSYQNKQKRERKCQQNLSTRWKPQKPTHTHTHTDSFLKSLKQIGTICFLFLISIFPTFADDEPTLIPTPASCNSSVLNTTEGSAALEAIYSPNTITTQWYTGYGANASFANDTTCSYNGTINLPATNPSRPGYAFNGWKLKTCTVPSTTLNSTPAHWVAIGDYGNGQYRCEIDEYENCNDPVMADLSVHRWKLQFSNGTIYGQASCQPTLPSADMQYLAQNLLPMIDGDIDPNQFVSEYTAIAGAEKGALIQQALQAYMSNDINTAYGIVLGQLMRLPSNSNYSTTDTGAYCVCRATHYTASGAQQCVLPSPWIGLFAMGASEYSIDSPARAASCAEACALDCALNSFNSASLRAAMVGSI